MSVDEELVTLVVSDLQQNNFSVPRAAIQSCRCPTMEIALKPPLAFVFFCLLVQVFGQKFIRESSESPCAWPLPPSNGVNFRRCGSRYCNVTPRTLKPSGYTKITECEKGYFMTRGERNSYCENGTWIPHDDHKCAECGRSQLREVTLIHHGKNASRGSFPWQAAVYLRNESNLWDLKCGGTLISEHLVLTAAHCVKLENTTLVKAEDIKVGLGKLRTDYYTAEPLGVINDVREVVVPERYIGLALNYALDIALLDLETPLTSSPNIMPACIDLEGTQHLIHREQGFLAGYGNTEDLTLSDVLKWSRQIYMEYSSCVLRIAPTNRKLLTPDKFCSSTVEGAKADYGDSGGGLTFVRDDVHFVHGVVSTRIPQTMTQEDIVLFTDVMEHREWLLDHWRRLDLSLRKISSKALDNRGRVYRKAALGDICRQEGEALYECKVLSWCGTTVSKNLTEEATCNGNGYDDIEEERAVCCEPQDKPTRYSPSKDKCKELTQPLPNVKDLCDKSKEPLPPDTLVDVKSKEFPFWAIVSNDKEFGSYDVACLISERYLITGITGRWKRNREVKQALLGIFDPKDRLFGDLYDIIEQIHYPSFQEDGSRWTFIKHNIQLLKLKTDVEFTARVRPICLSQDFVFPETSVIATGTTDRGDDSFDVRLVKENTTTTSKRKCDSTYSKNDDVSMICIRARNNFNFWRLDPLVIRLEDPQCTYGLVGLFNFYKGNDTRFVGYTRISYYLSWIESVVWDPMDIGFKN